MTNLPTDTTAMTSETMEEKSEASLPEKTLIPKKKKDKEKKNRRKGKFTAATADKYVLYQMSVNSPETDGEFLRKAYGYESTGEPRHFREDFCGTASLAAWWIAQGKEFTAEGYDIDPEPVEWGKEHNFKQLGEDAKRMNFVMEDARAPSKIAPDIRTAANFSYWMFDTRKEMLGYFKGAFDDLADNGIFVIDLYGGPEALMEMREKRKVGKGVTYVWDQKEYFPGSGEYSCAIHFRFKDGTQIRNCFEYTWRFWHLTELRDILEEVGFNTVTAYFEGTDPDDEEEGDGNFEPDERGENCEAWLAYLVASK